MLLYHTLRRNARSFLKGFAFIVYFPPEPFPLSGGRRNPKGAASAPFPRGSGIKGLKIQREWFVLCNKNSKTLANSLSSCYNHPVTKAEARSGRRGRGGLRDTGTGCRARGGRTAEGKDPVFSWGAPEYGAHCHEPWSAACVVLSSGNDGSGACGRPANETRDVCFLFHENL